MVFKHSHSNIQELRTSRVDPYTHGVNKSGHEEHEVTSQYMTSITKRGGVHTNSQVRVTAYKFT